MFWDKWIPRKYLVKSEICAVEACHGDAGTVYYYTHLKNKSNSLEIIAQGLCEDSLVLPEAIIKNKIPVLLVINGKGVILKKISLNGDDGNDAEALIQRHLPALNSSDFYIQVYKQEDSSAFIALCRKEQVNQLVSELRAKKTDLAAICIGAPVLIGMQPLWSNYNSIATSLHIAELSNNVLDTLSQDTEAQREALKIENLVITPTHTLGFAAGLSYLMQAPVSETNNPEISAIETQHQEKNKLRVLMIAAVAIAFVLAIGNVIFYTTYFDKNNTLETELSVYQGKYEQINELLNDYQKNKSLIEGAGVLNKNKLSEYGDRIGKTMPDEIVLSELYFNPKKETDNSEDSLVTFESDRLILKGNCSKSFIVNEWINVLKMQKFIKDVSLEKFSYNNEEARWLSAPNFEIRVITE